MESPSIPETTCLKCGGRLIKDWAGWTHARKPERPHVVKPAQS